MDRLKELEERKRQLKELRERRQLYSSENQDSLVSQLLKYNTEDKSRDILNDDEKLNGNERYMVSVAVQTDQHVLEDSIDKVTLNKKVEVITYDKAIQTDPVDLYEIENRIEVEEELDTVNTGTDEEIINTEPVILKPLVIQKEQTSIYTKTFSSEAYSKSDGKSNNLVSSESNKYYDLLHKWQAPIEANEFENLVCISIDYDYLREIFVICFQSRPLRDNKSNEPNILALKAIPKSYVFVVKIATNEIIDQLEFKGQLLTTCKILGQYTIIGNDIIPILLTTSRGKVILYELREKIVENGTVSWERNLTSKTYNTGNGGIFAISENKFRVICGTTDGSFNILNTIDLSVYKETTSISSKDVARIKLAPVGINDIMDLQSTVEIMFAEYLSRISLCGELGISSLVASAFDEDCIFVGGEDGGIYKLLLKDIDGDKLPIAAKNNAFLPYIEVKNDSTLNKPRLFHSGFVTGLSMTEEGLLLSSSIDWTCCLWDTKNNNKLDSISLQDPIISVQWLSYKDDRWLCCALTSKKFVVMEFFIQKTIDSQSSFQTTIWEKLGTSKIIVTIDTESLFLDGFTEFQIIKDQKEDHNPIIALGSMTNSIICIELKVN